MAVKESYIDEMTTEKSYTAVIGDIDIPVDFLVYKDDPTHCAIKINDRVYDEFKSYDKGFRLFQAIKTAYQLGEEA